MSIKYLAVILKLSLYCCHSNLPEVSLHTVCWFFIVSVVHTIRGIFSETKSQYVCCYVCFTFVLVMRCFTVQLWSNALNILFVYFYANLFVLFVCQAVHNKRYLFSCVSMVTQNRQWHQENIINFKFVIITLFFNVLVFSKIKFKFVVHHFQKRDMVWGQIWNPVLVVHWTNRQNLRH